MRDSETGEIALAYREPESPDHTAGTRHLRQHAQLWWNAHDDRLLELVADTAVSLALPDDGSTELVRSEVTVQGENHSLRGDSIAVSPDGKHLYTLRILDRLNVFHVDSPTQTTHIQAVPWEGVPGDNTLIVPSIRTGQDMALSPDGRYLYVAGRFGLVVFSRDHSTGMLQLVREIPQTESPDNPFFEMRNRKFVSLDGTGTILFVAADHFSTVLYTAVAAFDIATDPSNPAHLDTLIGPHIEPVFGVTIPTSHVVSHLRREFFACNNLVPHAELAAVDVFCANGYFVVAWNPATRSLEITDFAASGRDDGFGNRLPYSPGTEQQGLRQMAQAPDGAHVYRATNLKSIELSDAIHVYERASAMKPTDSR